MKLFTVKNCTLSNESENLYGFYKCSEQSDIKNLKCGKNNKAKIEKFDD